MDIACLGKYRLRDTVTDWETGKDMGTKTNAKLPVSGFVTMSV